MSWPRGERNKEPDPAFPDRICHGCGKKGTEERLLREYGLNLCFDCHDEVEKLTNFEACKKIAHAWVEQKAKARGLE